MEPGAVVTGRVVDADGRPRAGVELEVSFRPKGERYWSGYFPKLLKTDREGRFRVGALLPGCEYALTDDGKGSSPFAAPRSGQTKDLGDVRMKRAEQ
jgi:hypothetical protein